MNVITPCPALRGRVLGLGTGHAAVLVGLEAQAVRVEVSCTRGPSFFQMVGLAEAAVRESRVRVTNALARLGYLLDEYAITVNLAPADLRKSGAVLDLAIAGASLSAIHELPERSLDEYLLLGELSLEGRLQPIRGVLPLLLGAKKSGWKRAIVPYGNRAEAGLTSGLDVYVAENLGDVVQHLRGKSPLSLAPATTFVPHAASVLDDLSNVRGQASARRALEIAAAGHHNLLFVGPPGGGKTLLARLLPTILPPMTFEEAIEVTAIHSVSGLVEPSLGIVHRRPFRAPHHSVSEPGLVGGGDIPRPGEVSLAHHGVLFLDELAEFRRPALEALRQPLEEGVVHISRARARAFFPARTLVVAAVNPCPCGLLWRPSPRRGSVFRGRWADRGSGMVMPPNSFEVALRLKRYTAPILSARLDANCGGAACACWAALEGTRGIAWAPYAELGLTELSPFSEPVRKEPPACNERIAEVLGGESLHQTYGHNKKVRAFPSSALTRFILFGERLGVDGYPESLSIRSIANPIR